MAEQDNLEVESNKFLPESKTSPKKNCLINFFKCNKKENKIELDLIRSDKTDADPSQTGSLNETERLQWDNFAEYFLSIIGFVIDLGNVWRFPTVCYQNGGGAFIIPFLVCLFVIGMPCMYLELAAGQYFQSGNISIWGKINPHMKGIGYAVIIINVLMLSYYNTLQAYALYYFAYSFQSPLPWNSCNKTWSTTLCRDAISGDFNSTHQTHRNDVYLPSSEFFKRKVLGVHLSNGFDDLVGIKPDMLLCLFVIFIITSFCLIGGIKTSGKAVYVTAILPYICLAVLVVQSLFLDGAFDGLRYYLQPNFSALLEIKVWLAAAVQIFFSLGPGFGVLITYSSYTKKSTNIKNLTIMCSVVNCFTSLMYGLVVFAGLGYMAKRLKVHIDHFLDDGIGLVFIVYPEIIATFKGAHIFAIVFFIMLITLGMDSAFGGMEGLYTAIVDEFPYFKKRPLLTRLMICAIPFLTALPTVSHSGIYIVQWLDRFAISPSVLMIVLVETIVISWSYGVNNFCQRIYEMNGTIPFINWRISWKYICPLALLIIIVLDVIFFQPLTFGQYQFPNWSTWLGYMLNIVSLCPILFYALYYKFSHKKNPDKSELNEIS